MSMLGPQGSHAEIIARLNALAAEMSAHGWTASVREPRGKPARLHARNPEPGAAALSEHIYVRPRADGTWTYWWPWAEPIAETPSEAAAVIVRVLRPAKDAVRAERTDQLVDRSVNGHTASDQGANMPRQLMTPTRDHADSNADLEAALRNAEKFLAQSCASVHPSLSARTMLRYLHCYRAHLSSVVVANRRQQHGVHDDSHLKLA
jgi:hypothetical protein